MVALDGEFRLTDRRTCRSFRTSSTAAAAVAAVAFPISTRNGELRPPICLQHSDVDPQGLVVNKQQRPGCNDLVRALNHLPGPGGSRKVIQKRGRDDSLNGRVY